MAAAAVVIAEGFFNCLAGFAGFFLDTTYEFIGFAFGNVEIVVGQLTPLLFDLSFEDVPVAFELERVHIVIGIMS